MKILKIIGIVFLSLVILVFISGLILPKKVTIERSIVINDTVTDVYNQVCHFKNQVNWLPWNENDPNMEVSFIGADGKTGAQYHWKGNKNVGEGYQEITNTLPNERIDLDLVFTAPWQSQSKVYYLFDGNGNNTKVTWGYTEEMPIPKNVMMTVMGMKKMLSRDFDKGLMNLKQVCEKV